MGGRINTQNIYIDGYRQALKVSEIFKSILELKGYAFLEK